MREDDDPKYFTRHLFKAGLQCPAKLFYYYHNYPEKEEIMPFLEHAGFNKRQLTILARKFYPEGVAIRGKDYTSAFQETTDLLERDEITLFRSVFIDQKRLVKMPILVKKANDITLYNVQVKAFNPYKHRLENANGRLHSKWKSYVLGFAYQVYVIRRLYPEWEIFANLMLPNKKGRVQQDRLLQKLHSSDNYEREDDLFSTLDVTEQVDKLLKGVSADPLFSEASFEETLESLTQRYLSGTWESVEVGYKCRNCEFRLSEREVQAGKKSGFNHCWDEAAEAPAFSPSESHVFDLIGHGIKTFIDKGLYLQKQIPEEELTSLESVLQSSNPITLQQRQDLQIYKAKGAPFTKEIVKLPLFEEMKHWAYPLHFLDFEAGNYAVPVRKDRYPYQAVLFQFSCHTLYRDGSLEHTEWISQVGRAYPNYELVRQLMKGPGLENGTIVQYSNFERRALKIIQKELMNENEFVEDADAMKAWLRTIICRSDSVRIHGPHFVDLSRLVKAYYYNWYMNGSLSIKDVVQAIMTISSFLKKKYAIAYTSSNFENICWWQWDAQREEAENPYHILKRFQDEIKTGRGIEAMAAFEKILTGELSAKAKSQALSTLLQYCELDTLAMVMIYRHWKDLDESR